MIWKAHNILSYIVGIASVVLAWWWFGWELALIIFLGQWSRNLSRLAIYERTKEGVEKAMAETESTGPLQ